MDFDLFNAIFEKLNDTSLIHWLSLMFGDWVKQLFDVNAPAPNPVTALMIALSTCNIVSIVAVALVLLGTGVEGLFSGLSTANITKNFSSYAPLRISIAFLMLSPLFANLPSLSQSDSWISNGQANIVRIVILGGAVGDWVWGQTSRALIKYNIGGGAILDNTLKQSRDYLTGFICNEVYYQSRKLKDLGPKRYHYTVETWSPTVLGAIQTDNRQFTASTDDISEIPFVDDSPRKREVFVKLGGPSAKCGTFKLEVPYAPVDPITVNSKMPLIMEHLAHKVRRNAAIESAEFFKGVDTIARSAWTALSKTSHEQLVNASRKDDFKYEIVTPSSLNATGKTELPAKLNSLADNLLYLAQRTSYSKRDLGCASINSILPKSCKPQFAPNDYVSKAVNPKLFQELYSNYIYAGMFWHTLQEFGSILPLGTRYMKDNNVSLRSVEANDFCKTSFFSFSLSHEAEEIYECDAQALAATGGSIIGEIMYSKVGQRMMPDSLKVKGVNYNLSGDFPTWQSFANSTNVSTQSFADTYDVGIIARLWLKLVEFGWWISENEGSAASSGIVGDIQPTSLVSGTGLLMDITGTRSPYIFLTSYGEGLRDIAFYTRIMQTVLTAVSKSLGDQGSAIANTYIEKSAGLLQVPAFFIRVAGNTFGAMVESVMEMIGFISKLCFIGALIAIYVLPWIPIIGWIFIILGLLFTAGTAVGAVCFSMILVALPKGDSMLHPDTARILSLIYGVFIRQPLTVVGFAMSMFIGYVGFSLLNFIFFGATLMNLSAMGMIDNVLYFIFVIGAYPVILFFICVYSFSRTSATVEVIGVWFATHFAGGVFGANGGEEQQTVNLLQGLSTQLNQIGEKLGAGSDGGLGASGATENESRRYNGA